MQDPSKRLAIAVGASLAIGTLILFWSLHRALGSVQAFA
jgi:hypothetical protein